MYLQQVDNVYDLTWTDGVTYGDVHHRSEVRVLALQLRRRGCAHAHGHLPSPSRANASACWTRTLTLPAYDYCIKTSHMFNLLDARGAISVTERTSTSRRVRALARRCAESYLADREAMGTR